MNNSNTNPTPAINLVPMTEATYKNWLRDNIQWIPENQEDNVAYDIPMNDKDDNYLGEEDLF